VALSSVAYSVDRLSLLLADQLREFGFKPEILNPNPNDRHEAADSFYDGVLLFHIHKTNKPPLAENSGGLFVV
jgi:hypothetical protein